MVKNICTSGLLRGVLLLLTLCRSEASDSISRDETIGYRATGAMPASFKTVYCHSSQNYSAANLQHEDWIDRGTLHSSSHSDSCNEHSYFKLGHATLFIPGAGNNQSCFAGEGILCTTQPDQEPSSTSYALSPMLTRGADVGDTSAETDQPWSEQGRDKADTDLYMLLHDLKINLADGSKDSPGEDSPSEDREPKDSDGGKSKDPEHKYHKKYHKGNDDQSDLFSLPPPSPGAMGSLTQGSLLPLEFIPALGLWQAWIVPKPKKKTALKKTKRYIWYLSSPDQSDIPEAPPAVAVTANSIETNLQIIEAALLLAGPHTAGTFTTELQNIAELGPAGLEALANQMLSAAIHASELANCNIALDNGVAIHDLVELLLKIEALLREIRAVHGQLANTTDPDLRRIRENLIWVLTGKVQNQILGTQAVWVSAGGSSLDTLVEVLLTSTPSDLLSLSDPNYLQTFLRPEQWQALQETLDNMHSEEASAQHIVSLVETIEDLEALIEEKKQDKNTAQGDLLLIIKNRLTLLKIALQEAQQQLPTAIDAHFSAPPATGQPPADVITGKGDDGSETPTVAGVSNTFAAPSKPQRSQPSSGQGEEGKDEDALQRKIQNPETPADTADEPEAEAFTDDLFWLSEYLQAMSTLPSKQFEQAFTAFYRIVFWPAIHQLQNTAILSSIKSAIEALLKSQYPVLYGSLPFDLQGSRPALLIRQTLLLTRSNWLTNRLWQLLGPKGVALMRQRASRSAVENTHPIPSPLQNQGWQVQVNFDESANNQALASELTAGIGQSDIFRQLSESGSRVQISQEQFTRLKEQSHRDASRTPITVYADARGAASGEPAAAAAVGSFTLLESVAEDRALNQRQTAGPDLNASRSERFPDTIEVLCQQNPDCQQALLMMVSQNTGNTLAELLFGLSEQAPGLIALHLSLPFFRPTNSNQADPGNQYYQVRLMPDGRLIIVYKVRYDRIPHPDLQLFGALLESTIEIQLQIDFDTHQGLQFIAGYLDVSGDIPPNVLTKLQKYQKSHEKSQLKTLKKHRQFLTPTKKTLVRGRTISIPDLRARSRSDTTTKAILQQLMAAIEMVKQGQRPGFASELRAWQKSGSMGALIKTAEIWVKRLDPGDHESEASENDDLKLPDQTHKRRMSTFKMALNAVRHILQLQLQHICGQEKHTDGQEKHTDGQEKHTDDQEKYTAGQEELSFYAKTLKNFVLELLLEFPKSDSLFPAQLKKDSPELTETWADQEKIAGNLVLLEIELFLNLQKKPATPKSVTRIRHHSAPDRERDKVEKRKFRSVSDLRMDQVSTPMKPLPGASSGVSGLTTTPPAFRSVGVSSQQSCGELDPHAFALKAYVMWLSRLETPARAVSTRSLSPSARFLTKTASQTHSQPNVPRIVIDSCNQTKTEELLSPLSSSSLGLLNPSISRPDSPGFSSGESYLKPASPAHSGQTSGYSSDVNESSKTPDLKTRREDEHFRRKTMIEKLRVEGKWREEAKQRININRFVNRLAALGQQCLGLEFGSKQERSADSRLSRLIFELFKTFDSQKRKEFADRVFDPPDSTPEEELEAYDRFFAPKLLDYFNQHPDLKTLIRTMYQLYGPALDDKLSSLEAELLDQML